MSLCLMFLSKMYCRPSSQKIFCLYFFSEKSISHEICCLKRRTCNHAKCNCTRSKRYDATSASSSGVYSFVFVISGAAPGRGVRGLPPVPARARRAGQGARESSPTTPPPRPPGCLTAPRPPGQSASASTRATAIATSSRST